MYGKSEVKYSANERPQKSQVKKNLIKTVQSNRFNYNRLFYIHGCIEYLYLTQAAAKRKFLVKMFKKFQVIVAAYELADTFACKQSQVWTSKLMQYRFRKMSA